jgi:hypothetical protein
MSRILLLVSSLAVAASAHAQADECVAAHADAQLQRMHGALVAARQRLLRCAQTECPKPVADDCASWLGQIEDSLSSVVFAVSDDKGNDLVDVRVTADGKPIADKADGRALTIDPGSYRLRFEAAGYQPSTLAVSIRQSEKNRIVRAHMQPVPPPMAAAPAPAFAKAEPSGQPIPIASYVLAGTSMVGLGAFALFGLQGLSKEHAVERLPPTQACASLCSDGRRDYVLADIGLGVAIASAAGALAVWLLNAQDERPQKASLAAADGGGLRWSATF